MAGIGFELNKLISKKNFFSKFGGYFYTTSSCLGSMILGFVLLFSIQAMAKMLGIDDEISKKFTGYITNTVFLSMIIFGFFSLVLSRYISDLIYSKKEKNILSSFWGVIALIVPISIIIFIPILIASKITVMDSILLLILLSEFVCTWTATLYVTILKHYKKITVAFLTSMIVSIVILGILYYMKILNMEIMLMVIIFSYGLVLTFLISLLEKQFENEDKYTYAFIKWFSKYPVLAFTGLFTTLGTLIHFYIMWFSQYGYQVQGFIHGSPSYDFPSIVAYFSTIITSVTFVAILEPNFYKKYAKYFKLLNTSGSYKELHIAKKEMISTLKVELRNLIIRQIVVTLLFVIVISKLLSDINVGMTQSMIEIFKVLCVGYSLQAIGNVILQLQLYFADNKGAFITSIVFFSVTALGTIATLSFDVAYLGIGVMLGGAAMAIVGVKQLENYLENLEYNVLNKKEKNVKSKLYILIEKASLRLKKMNRNKVINKMVSITTIILLVCALAFSFYKEGRVSVKTFFPEKTDEVLHNPGVGLAPWAKNDETLQMDTQLVYIDLSWAEWEPEEGKYDYASFETKNHIKEYREQGRKAVFRFYMDYPSAESHKDIPNWLYEKIHQDGTWYNTSYGKGFSPNYRNKELVKCHQKAIEAFAQKYGNDNFFLYIELGSLGHWGEWHVNHNEGIEQFPDYETRIQYIEPYVQNFKESKLLMRYSIKEAKEYGFGLYNDMTGDQDETEYWFEGMKGEGVWEQTELPELSNTLDTWKTMPIGGEFASSYSNQYFLTEHLDITLLLLKQSHQSFIGPKIIIDEEEEGKYKEQMKEILKILGHRLFIETATIERQDGEKLNVSLNMKNDGIAPIYTDTQLAIYIYDENGSVVSKTASTDFNPQNVLPEEESKNINLQMDTSELQENKKYTLCVGLEDKNTNTPMIELAMEKYKDKVYKIGEFNW